LHSTQAMHSKGRLVVLALLLVLGSTSQCPKGCRCQRMDECEMLVECQKLKKFPDGYPKSTDCIFITSPALRKLAEGEKKVGLARIPATVKRLDLAESRLGEIGSGWFEHLVGLRVLNLEFNNLKTIPAYAFKGLSKLKVLWLTGNHYSRDEKEFDRMQQAGNTIKSIANEALVGLANLQVLLMHHNKIDALGDDVFQDLTKLKVLKLLDNPVARTLKKKDKIFDPIRAYCYQLDLRSDSGDALEDYWEQTRTYLTDEWFQGPPRKNEKRKKATKQDL